MTSDYEAMLNAYGDAGGTPSVFKETNIAHLIIHKNRVIGSSAVNGLILEPKETSSGVDIKLTVQRGVKIENIVYLCFGILPKEGVQEININVVIEDGAGVKLLAHCVFPNAVKVVHRMQADIQVGDGASYEYNEIHFHGDGGGIEVVPKAKIMVGNNSRLSTSFSLLKGRVGLFDLDYETKILENSSLGMTAKIYGYENDAIKIREAGHLLGSSSRGLLKSRVALRDDAECEILNELVASGSGARGHVDCVEIIQGNAKAKAIPIVNVSNESAKVTHEAAIGRVDKKQVETLMARGLDEEKAIDVVVGGLLK